MDSLNEYYYPKLELQIKRVYQLRIQRELAYWRGTKDRKGIIQLIKENCNNLDDLQDVMSIIDKLIDKAEFEKLHYGDEYFKKHWQNKEI